MPLPMGEPAIEVSGLGKAFGDLEAVKDVSFRVEPGERFGFLGPNGAGKTTTIKMLCTLLTPTRGTARLAGHDVVKDSAAVRRAIGVVFQETALDDRLTGRENLELHAVVYGVPRADRRARVAEALDFVALGDRASDLVRTYSGGMKRRLEIARGLVHRPRVLFLDEPTTGLDPQTRARTWETLRQLREAYGLTLFLTTHYMEEAEHCDRIAIIDHGQVVALDTPEALKRQVGKDRVTVRTTEVDALTRLLRERHGLEAKPVDHGLTFAVADGDAFVVQLLTGERPSITGISVDRPTLDDVFLALTGREIRAEGAEVSARAKAIARRRG